MEYMHQVPGRIRVRSPRLKNNTRRATEVRSRLMFLPGIMSVDTNPLTGSLTVRFDESATSSEALLTTLQQQGFSAPTPQPQRPLLEDALAQRALGKAGKALCVYLLKKAVEESVVAVVAALL